MERRKDVGKKEATKKNIVKRTGGGPPPDIGFKPWELDVHILTFEVE